VLALALVFALTLALAGLSDFWLRLHRCSYACTGVRPQRRVGRDELTQPAAPPLVER
jgi:hypothetical protein